MWQSFESIEVIAAGVPGNVSSELCFLGKFRLLLVRASLSMLLPKLKRGAI